MLQRTLHLPVIRRKASIDWLGAALIVSGVCALLIWCTLAGDAFAWASWQSAALAGGGLVLLGLAVRVESRAIEPIIPLTIFRSRTVSLATIATVVVGVLMFGSGVFLSQHLQISLGKSPTVGGLLTLPLVFGLLIASTVAGQQITKHGRWKSFLIAGAALMTVGMLPFSLIDERTDVWLLSGYMVVLGVSIGLLLQNLVLAAQTTAYVFRVGIPIALVALIAVMLIKEKPLQTLSGDERRAKEAAGAPSE